MATPKEELKVNCTCCKGTGKNTICTSVWGDPSKDSSFEMNCIDCNGTGKMTWAQVKRRQEELDAWCACGNPSERSNFHDDTPQMKHHYTCRDCGKITQVG